MSAIVIPLPSRQASRARSDEPVAGPASGRAGGQSLHRPRLRLVIDGFVPEAPVGRSVEGAQRPGVAPTHVPALPVALPMRRPATPAALRGRRSGLERLVPQHPAVRVAGLRHSALQEEDRRGDATQHLGEGEPVPSHLWEMVKTEVRSPGGLRLLRGGLTVVATALVLVCSGLAIEALAGMAWVGPATAVAQMRADTTTAVVYPSQSLWDIAGAGGIADIPGMVARIAGFNDLKGATIRTGQTLEIPAARELVYGSHLEAGLRGGPPGVYSPID